ncbi:MAG TPA: competence protein ComA [Nitrospiraceae bacterium]|jgi:nicotinamide-nucleotide amidase|nr:competence protein ComA [Nitrospiraceae bacterium]
MENSYAELIKKIHTYFRSSRLKLSVAESCTGGLVGHLLTTQPGASEFFDSSVVSYSAESKIKLLGIKKSLIQRYGTISEETARAMAYAIRKKRKTEFSLSITGNLGPKPAEEKKVGLVFMAVDWEKETISRGMIFDGDREAVKYAAAMASLRFLGEVVEVWA